MSDLFNSILQNHGTFSFPVITIIVATGFIVGFVNTLAGMATVLTYGLFMALGLPINIANGTTRPGILAQFAISSAIFKKEGYLDIKTGWQIGIPVAIGSFFGARMVAVLDTSIIEVSMGILMPLMAVFLLFFNKAKSLAGRFSENGMTWWKFIIFVVIGIYGGFTHSGVGILLIFGTILFMGADSLRANAIKQFAVLIYTPVALAVFIWYRQIDWPLAIIYAVGNVSGAILASKVAIKWGVKLINWSVVTVVMIVSFWLIYKQF